MQIHENLRVFKLNALLPDHLYIQYIHSDYVYTYR